MALSLSNESKNSITLTNQSKKAGQGGMDYTWDDGVWAWENSGDMTWETQRVNLDKSATNKASNSITISNQTKN